jgi:hypothetical protein
MKLQNRSLRVPTLLLVLPFLFLSACTIGQYSEEQLQATAHELAATSVSLTMTALPTQTALPTYTPIPTDMPTATPEVAQATSTATSTAAPVVQTTFLPTATVYGLSGDFDADKNDKADLNAPVLLDNQTEDQVRLVISSPIYAEYLITNNMFIILPEATYHYQVWIGNKGPISGSFSITNGDKHELTFYPNKVHFSVP